MDPEIFERIKTKAQAIYTRQRTIHNPYLDSDVILNADGFHHLQFSARRERTKDEQALKFRLLPLALGIIRKSATLQEYRQMLVPVGKRSQQGYVSMKQATYWGFVAIVGENKIKVRVVLRQIGDGHVTFWSVMPDRKLKNGQKLFDFNLEDN